MPANNIIIIKMGEKNNDQSIMDKSMRSVFGKFKIHIFFIFFLSLNDLPLTYSTLIYLLSYFCLSIQLVGNIPYEATEDRLKEIFSEVGPVLSLK